MKTLPLFLLVGPCACSSPERQEPAVEREARAPSFTVIPLQHAAAADVALALQELLPEARAVADERNNSIVVTGVLPVDWTEVKSCVAQLDRPAAAPAPGPDRGER
jgi:type II secretory pathway component GspD/PulD (secretin)